jgi:O-antigen ligase
MFLLFLPFQVWDNIPFSEQYSKVLFANWFSPFLFLFTLALFIAPVNPDFSLKSIDIALFMFGLYIFLHYLIIKPVTLHPLFYVENICLIGLYLLLRRIPRNNFSTIFILLAFSASVQAVFGLLQHFELFQSYHEDFLVTGTFFNPAPYAGYIAAIIPMHLMFSPILFSYKHTLLNNAIIARIRHRIPIILLSAVLIILSVLMLILSKSRAALLSFVISTLYLFFNFPLVAFRRFIQRIQIPIRIGWKFAKVLKVVISIICLLVIVLAISYEVYKYRPESVVGRIVIWKNTLSMVMEHPFSGIGVNQFAANYMHYQANYLGIHQNTLEASLADNTIFAFNEFLKILSELGIPGLLLYIILLVCVFFIKGETNNIFIVISKAGLLSLIIFSCFSYPWSILPLKVIFIVLIAVVASGQRQIFNIYPIYNSSGKLILFWFRILLIILTPLLVFKIAVKSWKIDQAYQKWGLIIEDSRSRGGGKCLEGYKTLYPLLKADGFFLSMFAIQLQIDKNYSKAKDILIELTKVLPTSETYLSLGDCYKQLGMINNAEDAYKYSMKLTPSKIRPVYALSLLYQQCGKLEKAIEVIESFLNRDYKKRTLATYTIELELIKQLKRLKTERNALIN